MDILTNGTLLTAVIASGGSLVAVYLGAGLGGRRDRQRLLFDKKYEAVLHLVELLSRLEALAHEAFSADSWSSSDEEERRTLLQDLGVAISRLRLQVAPATFDLMTDVLVYWHAMPSPYESGKESWNPSKLMATIWREHRRLEDVLQVELNIRSRGAGRRRVRAWVVRLRGRRLSRRHLGAWKRGLRDGAAAAAEQRRRQFDKMHRQDH